MLSSVVTTPSDPTLSIASAISDPISLSLLAEILATASMFSLLPTSWDISCRSLTVSSTAASIPFLRHTGLMPETTLFMPSLRIEYARTVEVVVPSPAASLVPSAAVFMSCAPMFSTGSSRSTLFAQVTPSFVAVGAVPGFSISTNLPLGPNVVATVL